MARTIPLHPLDRDTCHFAIVDDCDYDSVKDFKWFATKSRKTIYAIRTYRVNKKRITISMHRQILNAGDGELVDHKDGNGCNELRENLRIATTNQNAWNQRHRVTNKSGQKGVILRKRKNGFQKWEAYICVNYKCMCLGFFDNFEDAVAARKTAENQYFGEFVRAA